MIIEQEVVQVQKKKSDRYLPKVIKWKGINMIRNHSFYAAIDEIVKVVEGIGSDVGSDAVRIGYVGDTGTGKTCAMEAAAHAIHKRSKLTFKVKKFEKEELLNFTDTVSKLDPANHILIFDDVSFLAALYGKHKVDLIQQATTEIRHMPGGKDVKIIAMYGYHYTKALPPYLRQADFKFYTSVGSSEMKNLEEMVGNKKMHVVTRFTQQFTRARVKGYYTFQLGGKEWLKVNYRDPWILMLFYNNLTLRPIVSPKREWLEPICSICSDGTQGDSAKEFMEKLIKKYSKSEVKKTVQQLLLLEGKNTFNRNLVAIARNIDRAREQKILKLNDIAAEVGLDITKARLRNPVQP